LVSLCTETHWRCLFKARKVPTSPQILEYRRTGIGWKVYADWMRCASRDFGGDARLRARYWAVHEALVVASVTVADRGQTGGVVHVSVVAQETLDGRDKYLRIRRFAHETGVPTGAIDIAVPAMKHVWDVEFFQALAQF
jgi:hypothetical protein